MNSSLCTCYAHSNLRRKKDVDSIPQKKPRSLNLIPCPRPTSKGPPQHSHINLDVVNGPLVGVLGV